MTQPRQLHLNTNITGVGRHPAGWRKLDNPRAIIDLNFFKEIAAIAERGKLDAVFLSDLLALRNHAETPSQALEPTILLTALAGATQHIGLIGTASTTFNDPFNLARRFASVDHLSGGRVAFNAVTDLRRFRRSQFQPRRTALDRGTVRARAGIRGSRDQALG